MTSRICPFCEMRSLLRFSWRDPLRIPHGSGFSQTRLASAFVGRRKARPNRMALSPRVANAELKEKPAPTRRAGPFGGMNRTDPGIRVVMQRQRAKELYAQKRPRPNVTRRGSRQKDKDRQPGEMKALKMQRSLSRVSYGHRNLVRDRLVETKLFTEFPLLPEIQRSLGEALSGMVDLRPTPIQRLAIPAILGLSDRKARPIQPGEGSSRMKQYLLAAETGSGKTLSYLLPVLDATKRAELAEAAEASKEEAIKAERKGNSLELDSPPLSHEEDINSGRPRAVVLLPTAELVEQVGAIFKLFSHTVKQRVAIISATHSAKVIRKRLFNPTGVDIVVSTPHLFNSIATTTPNILSRVTHLVIDEADSLFDRSFAPITSSIVDRATPSLRSLILCSATIPRSLDTFLRERFPQIERLTTPNLHAIPRRVVLSVVDIDNTPYNSNRELACADTIWQIGRDAADFDAQGAADTRRVIVFVNERARALELARYLQTKGIDAAPLSRDTADARSGAILAAFTSTDRSLRDAAELRAARVPRDGRILQNTKVLVVTDIASRGIDTIAVRHVILHDVPHTSIDFIHRLGRTGRMGRRGRGVVLAGKDDRKDIIREVREAMFRGASLI